jgi:methionine salvage enolase-phosphatase E1
MKKKKIWHAAPSTFMLNWVCKLVKEEMTGVQFFRNRELNEIVQAILKFTGREVCVDQVYNHLRHWRARWVQVCRLKRSEGVRWVESTSVIMMEDDAYYANTKIFALHLLLHFISLTK